MLDFREDAYNNGADAKEQKAPARVSSYLPEIV